MERLMMEHGELWERLEGLDLEGDAPLSFSRRLVRDNGWTPEFARRVVGEYKRFLFLAATAKHPVTPSDEVDQAWHLHLVYTRSYWDELCGEVLRFPLHHGPTKGGSAEGAKFGDWYARTLESYSRAFGEEAPRDVWPEAKIRFGEAPHFRRVNTRRVWMVCKPEWLGASGPKIRGAVLMGRVAPVALLVLLAGCAAPATLNVSRWNGEEFLSVFWTLCALVVAGTALWRARGQAPFDAIATPPLGGYELARLKSGGTLAVDVALAVLHNQGALKIQPNGMLRATGAPLMVGPFERAVLQEIREDADSPIPGRKGLGNSAVGVQIEDIDQKLQSQGLLLAPEARSRANTGPLVAVALLVIIAVIRMLVGIARQRPVGFLVISIGALLGYAIYLWVSAPRRSKRGELLMRQAEFSSGYGGNQVRSFRVSSGRVSDAPEGDVGSLALFFAVVGASAFPAPLHQALWPNSGADGGGDSGGDDGGGGDGGGSGCGGCGGCGGGD